ncbi:methyltransferase family protein [Streptomyces canus]|uniref:methyltransferase family protein n=1 Tax=Streptomyces TaxID=1883 RepID=UPI0036F0D5CA
MRHPQYDGFVLIMIGFLLQWPTILTLIMFPILVYVYARLARSEEREVAAHFGEEWTAYAARTPAFAFWPTRPRRAPAGPRDDARRHPSPNPRHEGDRTWKCSLGP